MPWVLEESTQAYVFASPTVAGDVVLLGVLDGTLQARDTSSGALPWSWRTEAARANRGWVLAADGRFNAALLFTSSWGDASAEATLHQQSVGSLFSTPLVAGGTVCIGSADANVYALE